MCGGFRYLRPTVLQLGGWDQWETDHLIDGGRAETIECEMRSSALAVFSRIIGEFHTNLPAEAHHSVSSGST
jgi:hypothetical protein